MARIALGGEPHLVIQRCPPGRVAFLDDVDRQGYLDALAGAADASVEVHAYALLADQAQLVLTPARPSDLGRYLQRVGRRYVPGFNRRHGSSGSVWEGRFRAAALEPGACLLLAMRWVEQAPVRAGAVRAADEWPWSSAAHHVGRGRSTFIGGHEALWHLGNTPFEREARYRAELAEPLDEHDVSRIENAVLRGWPLGSSAYLARIAHSSGRAVMPRPRGRPRKTTVPALP